MSLGENFCILHLDFPIFQQKVEQRKIINCVLFKNRCFIYTIHYAIYLTGAGTAKSLAYIPNEIIHLFLTRLSEFKSKDEQLMGIP